MELTDDQRWYMVDTAIKAFIQQYPRGFAAFQKEMHDNRSKYGLSKDKELQKSNARCTLSFPVCLNPKDGQEDCLLPIIEKYLPDFAKKDSKYFKEFIKRYPYFSMAEKL